MAHIILGIHPADLGGDGSDLGRRSHGAVQQGLAVQLAEKHLKCSTPDETRWKDAVSHFVLRLAYCRWRLASSRACIFALHAVI